MFYVIRFSSFAEKQIKLEEVKKVRSREVLESSTADEGARSKRIVIFHIAKRLPYSDIICSILKPR